MRKIVVGAALLALLASALVAGAYAASTGPEAQTRKLTFVGRATSFTHVDNPPKNVFGQGDYVVYTGAGKLGTGTGQCTQHSKTGAKPVINYCMATFSLEGGQLIVAGAVIDEAKRNMMAVIGGTGSYRGARGQAVESYIDDESSRWALTFETT